MRTVQDFVRRMEKLTESDVLQWKPYSELQNTFITNVSDYFFVIREEDDIEQITLALMNKDDYPLDSYTDYLNLKSLYELARRSTVGANMAYIRVEETIEKMYLDLPEDVRAEDEEVPYDDVSGENQ